jgi:alginate O-acetyltransferase complex protein AlgI
MIFSSFEFIFIFLPLVFVIYFYINKNKFFKIGTLFLAISSLFFYSYWNIIYLPLILLSISVNYLLSISIKKYTSFKSPIMFLGILLNISLLGYFKYSDFFIQNVNFFIGTNYSPLSLVLPLAISFFTFQQIAFLVDSARGAVKKHTFLNYIVFVTFFPQLIAGPIVHHKEMMPQFTLKENRYICYKNIYLGIFVFSIGLFKKVVIADGFAIWASNGFDVMEQLNLIEAWVASLSYTFQLYFDFSGYTDMALGAALLFNINLPINFHSPYKSTNIRDFWRRWHITLSKFLKDYVYIPMGGNRKGSYRMYSNLIATFLIGGLWHGAGWTFVAWGAMHGIAIAIHRFWSATGVKLNKIVAWFITFNFLNISWVFFRAQEWEDALKILKGMFGLTEILLPIFIQKIPFFHSDLIDFGQVFKNFNSDTEITLWILIAFIVTLYCKNSNEIIKAIKPSNKSTFCVVIIFLISLLHLDKNVEFIYFNF